MKLVAIDIGTTKICVFVAQITPQGTFELVGMGKAPSQGLARGVVVDIYPAAQSIAAAVKEAELAAGCTIESAVIGISGSHIQSCNSQGVITIRGGTVEQHHIDEVLAMTQSIALPAGQKLLHALPSFYIVDGHETVLDPRGMAAVRLEAHAHIITGAVGSVHNLVRCTELAHVKVHDIILEPLASASAVLSADERHIGVALLDIGGGTSDFAIYQQGTIRHTKVYPIAGNIFTHDIALILRLATSEAERLKREFGRVTPYQEAVRSALPALSVDGHSGVEVDPALLIEILDARLAELCTMIKADIHQHRLARLMPAGLVVTGGGSLLQGITTRMQEHLGIPIRVGMPRADSNLGPLLAQPMHATGYGLLQLGIQKEIQRRSQSSVARLVPHALFARMRSWIFDFM